MSTALASGASPFQQCPTKLAQGSSAAWVSGAGAEAAAWLSLVAYARHVHTDYDDLLAQGYDADSARFFVAEEIEATLAEWGVRRKLGHDD